MAGEWVAAGGYDRHDQIGLIVLEVLAQQHVTEAFVLVFQLTVVCLRRSELQRARLRLAENFHHPSFPQLVPLPSLLPSQPTDDPSQLLSP